jgi:hypothetical protein
VEKAAFETPAVPEPVDPFPIPQRHLHSSPVPTTRIGRLFHYTGEHTSCSLSHKFSMLSPGLATSLAIGTASSYVRGNSDAGSPMLSEGNLRKLVDKLSRMRGAALKMGQFLSIQGLCTPSEIYNTHPLRRCPRAPPGAGSRISEGARQRALHAESPDGGN